MGVPPAGGFSLGVTPQGAQVLHSRPVYRAGQPKASRNSFRWENCFRAYLRFSIVDQKRRRYHEHMLRNTAKIGSLEAQVSDVGRGLVDSLRPVLRALLDDAQRPVDLCRNLGINKDLSGRLLKATRSHDQLMALHTMPGPEAIRTLLVAARRKVPRQLIKTAELAVDEFDHLINHVAGDRAALDAIISTWVPDARARFEMANKQIIFKGVSNLKGFSTDVSVMAVLVAPGSGSTHCDLATLFGYVNLKRLRPGTPIHVTNEMRWPGAGETKYFTLDGKPIEPGKNDMMLVDFCSCPTPVLETVTHGSRIDYLLTDDAVGLQSAVQVFFADFVPNSLPRYASSEGRKMAIGVDIEVPSKVLVLDALIHEDVRFGGDPELVLYDTTVLGTANPNDRERDIDRLDFLESIQCFGKGVSRCRSDEVPGYIDLLHHACERRQWDPGAFNAYRCRIQYPWYGSEVCMVFTPPTPESNSE